MSTITRALSYCYIVLTFFSHPVSAQLPSYVPTSGLILYYSCNGNTNDLSGNGINGTPVVAFGNDRHGVAAASLHFTGAYERVTTTKIDRTTTNSFSYSVWVNPASSMTIPTQGSSAGLTSSASYSSIVAPVDGWNWSTSPTDVGAGLNIANNGVYVVEHGQSITNVSLAWSGALSGWHHVVLVYSSKLPLLYVDGTLVTSGLTSSYIVHPSLGCDSFSMGSSYPYLTAGFGHGLYPITVPTYNYSGDLDDIAIYNRAITPCEVTQLYDTTGTSITISGTPSVCPGTSTTLTASVPGGTWSSANTGIAMVGTSSGVVTGTGTGSVNISYTLGTGCYSIVTVSVNNLPYITGTSFICDGGTTTLSYPGSGGTWSTTSTTATVGSASGIVTGLSAGFAVITYSLPSGCFSTKIVSINPIPPPPSGSTWICAGTTTTFTDAMPGGSWTASGGTATIGSTTGLVTGTSGGTALISYTLPPSCSSFAVLSVDPMPATVTGTLNVCVGASTTLSDATGGGTWTSSNTAVATVGPLTGIVNGVAAGTATISYTLPTGCLISTNITVNPLPAAISGITAICQGGSSLMSDAGGGTWTSVSPTIATIGSVSGVLNGILPGTDTIYYTLPTGCRALTAVTINAGPAAIAGNAAICNGNQDTLTDATAGAAWSSGNPSIASVGSGNGIVHGLTPGNVIIYYSLPSGCWAAFSLTVNPNPAAITGSTTMCAGQNNTLYASGGGYWSSSNTAVGSIGSLSGIVHGNSAGVTNISYSFPTGCFTSIAESVNPVPAPITGAPLVCQGSSTMLNDTSPGGSWTSGSGSVATIGSGSGLLTGTGPGTSVISYTLPTGCSTFTVETVNPLPGVITGSTSVCVGQVLALSDPGGGTWTSSNTVVATVGSSTGLVSGLTAGSVTITYSFATGCLVTRGVTVNPLPSVITGGTHVCVGADIALSDSSTGGSWTSSDFSVAYIDPSTGIVTGMAPGSALISYVTSGGCSSAFPVTINPLPAPITGGSALCAGTTLPLFDAGGTWNCSPATVATIGSASGIVNGVSPGAATVTYTYPTGCNTSMTVNVTPAPAPITGPLGICNGLSGLLADATPGGTWSSSDIYTANIYPLSGFVSGVGIGTATISYTLGTGCFALATLTVNSSPGAISGASHVCAGATTAMTDPVTGGTWTIAPGTVASIGSSSGAVTGISAGTASITYSLGAGCTVYSSILINPHPSAITGTFNVCPGSSVTLGDASPGGTWTSGNLLYALAGSTTGDVTGVSTGTVNITYTLPTGCAVSQNVTINPLPALISGLPAVCQGNAITMMDPSPGGTWTSVPGLVASIGSGGVLTGVGPGTATVYYTLPTGCMRSKPVTVNSLPSPISGPLYVCAGSTITLTDPGGGTWSSSSPNISIGTATGVVTGISAGPATITYTLSTGCQTTTTITVNPLPAAISGPSALCAGTTMTLTDTGGGTWTSSNPSAASIALLTGLVSGIGVGTTTITYTLPTSCQITKAVSVTTAPSAIAGPSSVCAGASVTLTDLVPGGTWTSSLPSVATINPLTGVVTGISASLTTTITYSLGAGCTVTKIVSVNPGPAAITGGGTLCAGTTAPLADATTGGTWASSLTSVATVTGSGLVNGLVSGTANITYTAAGCFVTRTVTVLPTPLPITGPVTVCNTQTITVSDAIAGGTWSTAPGVIAIGSATGIVTGLSVGSAVVTYSIGSCQVTRSISVNPAPVITGASGMCIGSTSTFTASLPGGSWTSSATGVATVNAGTGLVTAHAFGTTSVIYVLPTGCAAAVSLTVNSTPSSILGASHVCNGAATTLTNTAGGGTWSVVPATIASIGSATGALTGVAPGAAVVTYSLGSGCTATYNITVNPAPPAITGPATVCSGQVATYTDAVTGGIWTSSSLPTGTIGLTSGALNAGTPGVTMLYYTLSTGCFNTISVTVNPVPAAIMGAASVCVANMDTLSDATTGGTWSSSLPAVATVSAAGGVVSGLVSGTTTISYTLPTGCLVTRPVTVNPSPAPVVGGSTVCVGSAITLTDPTFGGSWMSASPGVATAGSTGVVTGIMLGTATISYVVAGCPAVRTITVSAFPGPVTGPNHVCTGASVTETNSVAGGVWSSSNPLVASAGTGTGVITGIATGTTYITYSLGAGCAVTALMTVNGLPPAISGVSHVCAGATSALGDPAPGGIWSSSNPGIGSVSATGVVTGIASGAVTISYMATTGCAATMTFSVIAVPAISGIHDMCAWGDTMTIHDSITTGLFTSSFAIVSNLGGGTGRVTSYAPGTASVSYIIPSGCVVTASFVVHPLPAMISGAGHLCSGHTLTLADGTPSGTWSSGNPAVATVGSATGIVTGVSSGSAAIFYTLSTTGCKVDTTIAVSGTASITGPSIAFIGSPITLTDTDPGGTWASSNTGVATIGLTSGYLSGVTVGAVNISYTTGGSCIVTRHITVMPPALKHAQESTPSETTVNNEITIVPNPTFGDVNLDIVWNKSETLQVLITNMAGEKITAFATTTVKDLRQTVPLQLQVPSGVYLLSVSGSENRYTARIVVNNR